MLVYIFTFVNRYLDIMDLGINKHKDIQTFRNQACSIFYRVLHIEWLVILLQSKVITVSVITQISNCFSIDSNHVPRDLPTAQC